MRTPSDTTPSSSLAANKHAGAPLGTPSRGLRHPLRGLLARLLRDVRHGSLMVKLPSGERLEGQGDQDGPHASLLLHNWRPLWKMLWHGDIGLAHSYRDGDWSTPDLTGLLQWGIRNEASWGAALQARAPARWTHRIAHLLRTNTRKGSRQNIAYHYDMGNDFYAQWLDASMLYSSGIYARGDETLEQAQAAKLARIVQLLEPEHDSQVLEIGCGWGALAQALGQASPRGCVTGLTLSTQQLQHARERVAAAGLGTRVDLRLQDYRDVQGRYDRIVSIEMLEAVGERYWPAYFQTLQQRLRPSGQAVVQVITIAEEDFARYQREPDFIQRFIFPGGMLPTVRILRDQALKAGLELQVAQSFGASYAQTLVDWRERFLRAWPRIEALGFDEAFRRLWTYYLGYCEAGFRTGRVDVGLYTLRHAGKGQ